MTGIEKSHDMVTALNKQKWHYSPLFQLIKTDIFDFSPIETFDCILITDSTFQELVYQKSLENVLNKLNLMLNRSGIIWIETLDIKSSQNHVRRK